jgi:hypothetical protein
MMEESRLKIIKEQGAEERMRGFEKSEVTESQADTIL